MNTPTKVLVAVVATAALGWLAFGFFGIQTLFTNNEVNEGVPDSVASLIAEGSDQGSGDQQLLGKGAFQQGDSTYTISGNAYLSRIKGQLNLTFSDFDVTNGPNLYVYAVKTTSTDNKEVKAAVKNGEFVSLGLLKGNIGDQNYVIDADFDPNEYRVISIWCERFGRNFGSVNLAGVTSK